MTQNKNLLIAITGGIGSGKSLVSKILKDKGYTVFSADEVYAELLRCNDFVAEIHNAFGIGGSVLELNRKAISELVFKNPEKLAVLNQITHSKIMNKLMELSKDKGVVFNEVPLLFEGGYDKLYDRVIVVTRSLKKRIQAVILRDGVSEEDVIKRINNQFNYENLNANKHTIIVNDTSVDQLEAEVNRVLNEIL